MNVFAIAFKSIFKFLILPALGIYILVQMYRTLVALNHIFKAQYPTKKRVLFLILVGSVMTVFVIIAFWCIWKMNCAFPIHVRIN